MSRIKSKFFLIILLQFFIASCSEAEFLAGRNVDPGAPAQNLIFENDRSIEMNIAVDVDAFNFFWQEQSDKIKTETVLNLSETEIGFIECDLSDYVLVYVTWPQLGISNNTEFIFGCSSSSDWILGRFQINLETGEIIAHVDSGIILSE